MNGIPIVVLASGRGSNFEAIHRAIQTGGLAAEIGAVVSDRRDAPVLQKAKAAGISALSVLPKPSEARALHERRILEAIRAFSPRFLVLAGYMRIVTPELIGAFRSERGYSRIVNIHPSLLPAFPGLDGYGQAFRHGAKIAGCTVHLVDTEVDSGPICAQQAFPIVDCASAEEVEKRGLKAEHELYPAALSWILPEKFEVEKREERLCVRPH